MMLSEDEARERWCPMGAEPDPFVTFNAGGNPIRVVENKGRARCLGQGCMFWRWADPEIQFLSGVHVAPDASEGWVERRHRGGTIYGWERPFPSRRGYCGAAGKPT